MALPARTPRPRYASSTPAAPPAERQHECLGHELTHEALPACPKRNADGQLLAAIGRSDREQRRKIQATDDEDDQRNQRQNLDRRPKASEQSLSHAFHRGNLRRAKEAGRGGQMQRRETRASRPLAATQRPRECERIHRRRSGPENVSGARMSESGKKSNSRERTPTIRKGLPSAMMLRPMMLSDAPIACRSRDGD